MIKRILECNNEVEMTFCEVDCEGQIDLIANKKISTSMELKYTTVRSLS